MLTPHGWIAVSVTVAVFLALQLRRRAPMDLLFLGGLVVVTASGVLTPQEAVAGFASTPVLTIGSLLVVAAGLRATGVLDWIGHRCLGSITGERSALGVLTVTLVSTSAFLLNTALVAMAMPVVLDWCRKRNVSPSRLLIPVSYLAILGGVCTLIGTSTTLVANATLNDEYGSRVVELARVQLADPADLDGHAAFVESVAPMRLFEIGCVGLPCALVGAAVLLLCSRYLLPNRTDLIEKLGEQRREYLVEMLVQPDCRLIGQSVEQAGMRNLPGLFLIEIDRNGDVITPVGPTDVFHQGDRLIFTGVVSTIIDLEKIPGLVPAADMTYEFHPTKRQQRHLTEVVLSRTSPLIGTTVRAANFRHHYNAAVVAVHRNGARLTNKIGNIELEPGDTLLLQTREAFIARYRNSRDFYLVSAVEGAAARRHDRAWVAGALAAALVGWLVISSLFNDKVVAVPDLADHWRAIWTSLSAPSVIAIGVAVLMVVTRCLRVSEARGAIDLQLLFTIVGALGLGKALSSSGAAESMARGMVSLVGDTHPLVLLIVIYVMTMIFTEMITNNAVAAMLLPLAIAVAWESGHNPRPFIMAVTLAASLSFITPIGYQTNLMVMGPGGYRPRDYLRAGLPIALVVGLTAIVLIPQIWPF